MARMSVAAVAESRYWRVSEARLVVAAWRRSGETLHRFAQRYGVDPGRVGRWVKRLEAREEKPMFHPVRVVARPMAGQEPYELLVPNGTRIRVPVGFDDVELARLLAVVSGEREC